ncbi:hypothetical protein SAMN04487895_112166 [Paenibacillus sophorae]|uniref:Uncharacterized protein n=1 Tax=Paenibacillus sophorae TaxID=1333845 RepID=A0A1H8SYE4_9BACL|nr:hypothetical protein [Paenibacillus sophorae]QWU15608.1 hypothetical protein KP014_27855 [Paenibacillus sophorae]SEO83662.1 hypothetical protein SAMN04487895_112166 [Paenibacillus sophorae]
MINESIFKVKATEREAMFARKAAAGNRVVYTIKSAKANVIEKITEKYINIRSANRDAIHRNPRSSLRRALTLFFYRRIVTLKQLMKVHAYSSAMAALIQSIMLDICKVMVTKTGAVQLTLRGLFLFQRA